MIGIIKNKKKLLFLTCLCSIFVLILYHETNVPRNRLLTHQLFFRTHSKKTSTFFKAVTHNVNEQISVSPDWVRDYVDWHQEQRKFHMNDPTTKFLIMACHRTHFCGGVADRLKSIPFYVLLAHRTRRVLLIKWEKGEVEDYFMAPVGGIDWHMPEDIDISTGPDVAGGIVRNIFANPLDNKWASKKNLIIRSSGIDVYTQYNKKWFTTEKRPYGTFTEIWDMLFTPIPPLQKAIDNTMRELKLTPKKYAVAQYRAPDKSYAIGSLDVLKDGMYGLPDADEEYLNFHETEERKTAIHNSIDCAFHLSKNYLDIEKVYFTSSDINDVKYVLHESPYSDKVIGKDDVPHFHSEKLFRGSWKDTNPANLYPVFVDLYIMKYSRCVSFGRLGFGAFGARLSGGECVARSNDKCPSP